jgi:uroporphyrinogen III methyltransferase/synthase
VTKADVTKASAAKASAAKASVAVAPAAKARRSRKAPTVSTPVGLVGIGPGDPGLLTVRAAELIGAADVIIGDLGQCAAVLGAHARPTTECVDTAGLAPGSSLGVAEVVRLLVRAAKDGRRVVRLFTGDPFLGSSGPEHAAGLAKAEIAFEVVPGVSAASGVPTYAGVPLTVGAVREVRVVDARDGDADWGRLAPGRATIVIMGAEEALADVASALVAGGRAATTPAAVISEGSSTRQRTVVSTLDEVAAAVKEAGLNAPSLVVVGEVVARRETLSWFETKALFGWRVLVPRTKEQAGALTRALRAHGAVAEEVPTIAVEPPRTPQQMERAIKGLVTGRYAWVAFTSRNAVKAVRERVEEYGLDARAFAGIKVAAVGEQTAGALREWGIEPDLVPSAAQSAAGLVEDWPAYDGLLDPIDRVLLPRADIATETLVAGLIELGWEVDDVTAYRTVRAAPPAVELREAIKSGGFDAVVFTSSSTVRNLVGIAGKPYTTTVIACIGPETAKTAQEHGLRVDVLAAEPSVPALVAALAGYGTAHRVAALAAGDQVLRPSERRPGARRKAT